MVVGPDYSVIWFEADMIFRVWILKFPSNNLLARMLTYIYVCFYMGSRYGSFWIQPQKPNNSISGYISLLMACLVASKILHRHYWENFFTRTRGYSCFVVLHNLENCSMAFCLDQSKHTLNHTWKIWFPFLRRGNHRTSSLACQKHQCFSTRTSNIF